MKSDTPQLDHGVWWVYTFVLPVVTGALEDILPQLPNEEREGGYFCLFERSEAEPAPPVIVALIGKVPNPQKKAKYFSFSQEKALRLASHSEHLSSWLSRDPDNDKWGGAIVAGGYYLSFSGLPELADEAVMLLVGLRLGLLTWEEATAIAEKSDNHIFLGKRWLVVR